MLEAIATRQSIRKYTDKEVTNQQIEEMLHAAMRAPSARHIYATRYMVISNKEDLLSFGAFSPKLYCMDTASKAILVMFDKELTGYEFGYVDAAAAIENMLLEAKNMGLGTCWCAVGPREDRIEFFKNKYQVDDKYELVAIVSVGYPDEVRPIVDRFDPNNITWL